MSIEKDQVKESMQNLLDNRNTEPSANAPLISRRKVLGALGMALRL